MASASERSYTRRDTVMFVACLILSFVGLFSPTAWGMGIAASLRETVLQPLIWLQARAEEGKTSRERFRAVTLQRDSASHLAQGLPSLLAENERLRQLLALSRRLPGGYVGAEVLHQSQATDGRTLLLNAGARDGVAAFDPVVAPEGLLGVVLSASEQTSIVMTWAHPEFRVSAFTVNGNAAGVVAPSPSSDGGEGALEFRGVPYRDSVPVGTLVLSSGLGGVYPKGIPVGTVTGVAREQAGWERVYRLQPTANPGSAAHVLVLVSLVLALPAFLGIRHIVEVRRPTLASLASIAFVPGMIALAALVGMELVAWQMAQPGFDREQMIILWANISKNAGIVPMIFVALLFPIAWLLAGIGLYLTQLCPRWAAALVGLAQLVGFVSELAGGPKWLAVAAQIAFGIA